MATGYSFVDNNQISVREKIDRYFEKKKNAIPVLDESTSDESSVDSISHFVSFIFHYFNMLAA